MSAGFRFPLVPASSFGIVLGLVGLGSAWRAASKVWNAPPEPGEALMLVGSLLWSILILLYGAKWLFARQAALEEWKHPIQGCFIGLAGVATTLVSTAALPYSRTAGLSLLIGGSLATIAFAVWRSGTLWQGGRTPESSTPVLYLPTVGGGFVTATGAAAFGFQEIGQLAFGAALFSWVAIESVLLHRLYTGAPMAPELRPTLGIQLAPPTVGGVAALSLFGEAAGFAATAMLGYALLQALVLLRLLPWIGSKGFSLGFWGFSFGATALATLPLRLIEAGQDGAAIALAPYLFVGANLVILAAIIGTLRLAITLPTAASPIATPTPVGPAGT